MFQIVLDEDGNEQAHDALSYTKRNEFTSEIYKMEVKGLPKFFPPGVS